MNYNDNNTLIVIVIKLDQEYVHNLLLQTLNKHSSALGYKIQTVDYNNEGDFREANNTDDITNLFNRLSLTNNSNKYNNIVIIQYKEYEYINWDLVYSLNQQFNIHNQYKLITNSYCIRKALIRKANLAYIINKYNTKLTSSKGRLMISEEDIINSPKTWMFSIYNNIDEMEELMIDELYDLKIELEQNNSNTSLEWYCLKASMANNADYIELFSDLEALYQIISGYYNNECNEASQMRDWVIQKVIEPPIINKKLHHSIDGCCARKFHIRTYVLMVGNLKVYVYKDFLALFSNIEYTKGDKQAFITNTCYQTDNIKEENNNVMLFDEIKQIDKQIKTVVHNQIKQQVKNMTKALVDEPNMFQPLNNAFEIYGLDFVLDQYYKVYFVEANSTPDLKQSGNRLKPIMQKLYDDVFMKALELADGINRLEKHENNMLELVYESEWMH